MSSITARWAEEIIQQDDRSFQKMKSHVETALWELHDAGEDVHSFLMELIKSYGGDPNNPPPQYRHLVPRFKRDESDLLIARMPKTQDHIIKMEKKKKAIMEMVGKYNKQRQAKIDMLKQKLREIDERSKLEYMKKLKQKQKRKVKKRRHKLSVAKRKQKELELKWKKDKEKNAIKKKKLKAKKLKAKKLKEKMEMKTEQRIEKNDKNTVNELYEQILLERQKQLLNEQQKQQKQVNIINNESIEKNTDKNLQENGKKLKKKRRRKKRKVKVKNNPKNNQVFERDKNNEICTDIVGAITDPKVENVNKNGTKPKKKRRRKKKRGRKNNVKNEHNNGHGFGFGKLEDGIIYYGSNDSIVNNKLETIVNNNIVKYLTFDSLYNDNINKEMSEELKYDYSDVNDELYDYSTSDNEIAKVIKEIDENISITQTDETQEIIMDNNNDEFVFSVVNAQTNVDTNDNMENGKDLGKNVWETCDGDFIIEL